MYGGQSASERTAFLRIFHARDGITEELNVRIDASNAAKTFRADGSLAAQQLYGTSAFSDTSVWNPAWVRAIAWARAIRYEDGARYEEQWSRSLIFNI